MRSRLRPEGGAPMSDTRTNEELAETVCADILWFTGHGQDTFDALRELLRRADEGEKLRELAEAACVVARLYGETLCQGNEGREFMGAVDAVFPKETKPEEAIDDGM